MNIQEGQRRTQAVKRCSPSSSRGRWLRARSVNTWLCTIRGREFDSSAVSNQFKTNLEDVTKRLDEFQATAASAHKGVRDLV